MEKLQQHLSSHNTLIITDVNRHWFTGFKSSLGYLFVIGTKKILYVDSRYIEAARNNVHSDIEVRLLQSLSYAAKEIINEFNISSIEYEAEISIKQDIQLKKLFEGIHASASVELSDLILAARSVKKEQEVECIVKAQRCAERAFENILNFIRPDVTEQEIRLELEYNLQKAGAEGMSFETIAISGANTSMPHGVPTQKKVKAGEFVTMDFGGVCGGYCSDMTRTVAVGYVTDEMEQVYNTVLNAQLSAINAVKSGVEARCVDDLARSIIEKAGYGNCFQHSLGHGVGLEIHESPNLSPTSKEILNVGNIITAEPGIYIEGKFGVRIEDMLLVTENGARNLTNSKKNLIILK